jgi:hypothetical protein
MLTKKEIQEFERTCLRLKLHLGLCEVNLEHAKKFKKTDAEIMDCEVQVAKAHKMIFENYARLQVDYRSK